MKAEELQFLLEKLFPLNRSLTGDGNRETLSVLKEIVRELEVFEVPSGEEAFDWIVPREWRVNHAYVETLSGEKLVDFSKNNLHLVGYSSKFEGVVSKQELLSRIHTIPHLPEAIPYVHSYYRDYWGFCIAQNELTNFKDNYYRVVVDTEHFQGHLTYGEIYLPGHSSQEIVFSTYIDHPSLANDNLSGPIIATALASSLVKKRYRKYSYRFLFLPETVGTIFYLSRNISHLKKNALAVYVLTCLGDNRGWSMINSRNENTLADVTAEFAFKDLEKCLIKYAFTERGSDERQYGSPLIDLPVVTLMRSKFGAFPEYHNSMDNLDFVNGANLAESLEFVEHLVEIHENNEVYENLIHAEPWLSKRGLARENKENRFRAGEEKLIMDFLAFADGERNLLQITQRIKANFKVAKRIADDLINLELIRQKTHNSE
jgi:aminopeptidase-like protein